MAVSCGARSPVNVENFGGSLRHPHHALASCSRVVSSPKDWPPVTRSFSLRLSCPQFGVSRFEADGGRRRDFRIVAGEGESGSGSATETRGAGDGSYLSMWRRARERQEQERLTKKTAEAGDAAAEKEAFTEDDIQRAAQLRREKQFESILQVPAEERDKVQRLQVVDRAAAALAAAQALLADLPPIPSPNPNPTFSSAASAPSSSSAAVSASASNWLPVSSVEVRGSPLQQLGKSGASGSQSAASPTLGLKATPGPDFWAWTPPPLENGSTPGSLAPHRQRADPSSRPMPSLVEKDRSFESLPLSFESDSDGERGDLAFSFSSRLMPSLPPLQSLIQVEKQTEAQPLHTELDIRVPEIEFEEAALFATQELQSANGESQGVKADGSRWWKETGVEERENGIVCHWTVIRGVSADGSVEWEEKFWEAYDDFDYKELGAEKSGRDATGGVWRESWKEIMWQDALSGMPHMEKSADKWAKNGQGGQWHEKWWEHYDAAGKAEKWADKWSQIDPTTPLEPGHAHVWHERWGEKYDGQGSCMKYTDKWAERAEYGGGWTKWGDKWDEHFDKHSKGVKQGETWWEGQSGERWNRTWGEGHNGSGWVHKYGMSSSGEHWDTHEQQDTWYEKKPHYGFKECYDSSRELRKVGNNKRTSDQDS